MLRSSHPRCTNPILVALALTAFVAVAYAEPKPDPSNPDALVAYKLEVEAGTSSFRAGMYNDARVSFERAYSLYPEPVLLFNIASCYRRAGEAQNAIDAYRRFLDAAPADDHRITLATQTIASLENEIAAAQDDDVDVQVSEGDDEDNSDTFPILSLSDDATAPPPAPLLTAPSVAAGPGAPSLRRSRLRTYGLGIASAGSLMLLGAVIDGYRARSLESALDSLPSDHQWNHDDAEQYRAGERAASRARLLALSGGALTVTGATVYIIGRRRDAKAPRIEAAVGGGGGQVVLRGRF